MTLQSGLRYAVGVHASASGDYPPTEQEYKAKQR